ncbi:MAG TPA: A24 family peptidase [Dehalococcoidia bacterium]|jgi:prepilin signal peptidase PulO-like enzyme (type II secretory pathway)|nr:A24 family peptidase [Dehalococcoidia bacterium]
MGSVLQIVAAALAGLAIGWTAASYQHLLYREDEYRTSPLRGKKALFVRSALAAAFAATFMIAFRPDHYSFPAAAASAVVVGVLTTLASTDFERRRIPNRLVYPAMLLALGAMFIWPDRNVWDALYGAGLGFGVGALMVLLGAAVGSTTGARGTAFGIGDAKMIFLLGILVGWPRFLQAMLLGVLAAGLPAIVLLAMGGRGRTYSYGPYLAFGGAVLVLWPDLF